MGYVLALHAPAPAPTMSATALETGLQKVGVGIEDLILLSKTEGDLDRLLAKAETKLTFPQGVAIKAAWMRGSRNQ